MISEAQLEEYYRTYFQSFRKHAPSSYRTHGYDSGLPNNTAAPLPLILEFARRIEPEATILDAGAGATSFILRKLFPNVVTVDRNSGYLQVIKNLCLHHGLSQDGFIHGLENCKKADYTFYDYDLDRKGQQLPIAGKRTSKGLLIRGGAQIPDLDGSINRSIMTCRPQGCGDEWTIGDDYWVKFST